MNFPYLRRFCSDQIPPARLSLSPPAGAESSLLHAPVRPELDDHEVGGAREGAVDDGNPGWTENGGWILGILSLSFHSNFFSIMFKWPNLIVSLYLFTLHRTIRITFSSCNLAWFWNEDIYLDCDPAYRKTNSINFCPLILHQSNDSLVIIVDDVSPSAEGGDVDGGVLRPPAAQDLDGVKVLLSVKHRELKRKLLLVASLITKV